MVLLLAFSVWGPAAPQTSGPHSSPAHAKQVHGEKRTVDGISNFGEVTPGLFRGGQPTVKGLKELKKLGVDIIVDTRSGRTTHDSESKMVSKLGIKYVPIPWHCPFPHDEPFAEFLRLVRDNPEKKIFVHCRLGDDRTGMMIAAYRMAEGWSANDAMLEMEDFGFTGVHHLICPRLASYERSFPKRLKSDSAFEGVRSLPPSGANQGK
ncbi:MAG: tyrosine-protein phosphatase [Terriglobales bacterium]